MTSTETEPRFDVLAGGGELGELMRGVDWTETPLGAPATWPQSLKTAVRIMLTSRQPIWIGWGADLTYLYNDAYKSIIGGRHPWALGKPTSAVWSEIWDDIGPMLDTAMQGIEGTYVEEQLLIMERNGYPEETYYTFSYSPIPDDDGAPGGIICANSEDTKRVIGERQLGLLRELASRTVAARGWREACMTSADVLAANTHDLPFAAIYMGEDGTDLYRLLATSGIDAGHPLLPDILGAEARGPWPAIEDLCADEPFILEDDHLPDRANLPNGAWPQPLRQAAMFPIAASGRNGLLVVGLSPVRLLTDDYRGFLSLIAGQIGTAVANAEAYERERQRAEALAEIDRAKTIFFSNVSHEFRTPLTLMLGPLDELLSADSTVDPDARALVDVAHRNGLRLLRLVNSLLDFARLEAGRVEAHYEPLDLGAVTADLASNFRAACESAGISLDVDTPALTAPVYVDREMWEKIVLNLISNAFKYTLSGHIGVKLRPGASHVELIVADTGVGIPADALPRLFDRFYRIEGQQGRTHEGSGIGLALVQELVQLHGGSIDVSSIEGAGTTFTVSIPMGIAHLPADRIRALLPSAAGSTGADAFVEEALRWLPEGDVAHRSGGRSDSLGRETGRILIVDDNADMRDYVSRLLMPLGYDVETAGDGEAALAAVRARKPDLILTDVMMPRLDGFGLLAAIRSDPDLRELPVIMLSARAGDEARYEGIEAGADDYLTKPFAGRELVARVSTNLTAARLRSETAAEVRASELRLRRLFEQAPGFIAILSGPDHVFEFANTAYGKLFGDRGFTGRSVNDVFPEIAGQGFVEQLDHLYTSGQRFSATSMPLDLEATGDQSARTLLLDFIYEPILDADGKVTGVFVEGYDVADRVRAETALHEETRTLDTLNRSGASLAGQLDVERVVQMVTDAGVDLTGAQFGAFFYNVLDQAGESYMLYTLSGVDRAAFENFPMPRNTAVFAPTFSGESVIRSADIRKDPRYGLNTPYHGMPDGHLPVCSYLSLPVTSRSGEVLGCLFFGHPEPDRFDERHERLMVGVAAQASIAIDNARLYEAGQRELADRRKAEEDLRQLNETLERRVAEAIADREQAAEALRQAQKMEAVGQLTGGVAHDFNNLLTIITGNMDMVSRSLDRGDETRARRAVENAQRGAERAASLTQRLLAFSRRQPLEPRPIDMDRLVAGMSDLLNRALGETVRLEIVTTPGLWRVEADPNQLENCLLNLAVNARDAMPDGGKLTIETANARLDESYSAAHAEVAPGHYAVIAVSDTGTGMSRETLARVFEPFFTTKEVGRGTGLGLSMVYGFVKQSGGHVKIYSEEGAGTTIKIYLPRLMREVVGEEERPEAIISDGNHAETILVAEDDDDVRAYTVEILRELGYQVLEAHDGPAALRILANPKTEIALLFTDVVMPDMPGSELVAKGRALRPDLKVLYTSGYTRNAIVHNGRLDAGVEMIAKPFTYQALSTRIREILDAGSSGRVLVIEADAGVRMLAAEVLSAAGHLTDEAANAAEALSKLRAYSGRYSAVLLDADLPDGRSIDLMEEIRAIQRELPVLLASRSDIEALRERFAQDRCALVVEKPLDGATITAALQEVGVRCRADA